MKKITLTQFDAPVEIIYYTDPEDFPFSFKTLEDFHVAMALQLCTEEEDRNLVKTYTQKHLKIIFDEFLHKQTIAYIITREGIFVGAGYLVEVGREIMNLRQFHIKDLNLTLGVMSAHFQAFPNIKRLRFRLFSQRVEFADKLMKGKLLPLEIGPYEEDDKDILDGLSVRYFEFSRESFAPSLK